jgi:hypothetical protein
MHKSEIIENSKLDFIFALIDILSEFKVYREKEYLIIYKHPEEKFKKILYKQLI